MAIEENGKSGYSFGRTIALLGTGVLLMSCSKSDEVAHTTPAQNAAMNNLDVLAKTPPKKADAAQVPPPAR